MQQQLVRFVIEQYRDELLLSMHGSLDEGRVQQDRETIASELLNILHSIPIQSIATNGPSLVHKVRFVASTLLDAVRKAETAPATAARAHAYLCKHRLPFTSIHPLTSPQGTSCLSCRRSSATTCSMTVVMLPQARMAWAVLRKGLLFDSCTWMLSPTSVDYIGHDISR